MLYFKNRVITMEVDKNDEDKGVIRFIFNVLDENEECEWKINSYYSKNSFDEWASFEPKEEWVERNVDYEVSRLYECYNFEYDFSEVEEEYREELSKFCEKFCGKQQKNA